LGNSPLLEIEQNALLQDFVGAGLFGEGEDASAFEKVQYLNPNARPLKQNRLAARHALLPNVVNILMCGEEFVLCG